VQLSIIESDRYKRQVAEVFTILGNGEEKLLQEEQLKSGMALVYHQYISSCPNGDSILKAEEIARKNRVGV
jgi:endonuclease YncB( thermonuclease family)